MARLDAFGLLNKWQTDAMQNGAATCLRKIDQEINNKMGGGNKKRLTLEGLSGAFVILGIGYSLAIAAFIVELVHGSMRKRNHVSLVNRLKPPVRAPIIKKELQVEMKSTTPDVD